MGKPSIHLDPHNLQNSFQVVIAEKSDFNRAFALGIFEAHFGPKRSRRRFSTSVTLAS